jgi:hypothetical protein
MYAMKNNIPVRAHQRVLVGGIWSNQNQNQNRTRHYYEQQVIGSIYPIRTLF